MIFTSISPDAFDIKNVSKDIHEMNKNIACSIKKARDELGYKPIVSLEEGMRRSMEEFYK